MPALVADNRSKCPSRECLLKRPKETRGTAGRDDFHPKFLKKFANVRQVIVDAVSEYSKEVREGAFPDKEHSFELSEEESGRLYGRI